MKTGKPSFAKAPEDKPIGAVTHYFGGIKVAIIKFKTAIKTGSTVVIRGATTNFKQKIASMQYDHQPVFSAKPNKLIGIKVSKRVRVGDLVYKG